MSKKEDTKQGKSFSLEEMKELEKKVEAAMIDHRQLAIKAEGFLDIIRPLIAEKEKEDE